MTWLFYLAYLLLILPKTCMVANSLVGCSGMQAVRRQALNLNCMCRPLIVERQFSNLLLRTIVRGQSATTAGQQQSSGSAYRTSAGDQSRSATAAARGQAVCIKLLPSMYSPHKHACRVQKQVNESHSVFANAAECYARHFHTVWTQSSVSI